MLKKLQREHPPSLIFPLPRISSSVGRNPGRTECNTNLSVSQAEWDRYLQIPDSLIILFIGAEFAGPSRTITPVYAKYDRSLCFLTNRTLTAILGYLLATRTRFLSTPIWTTHRALMLSGLFAACRRLSSTEMAISSPNSRVPIPFSLRRLSKLTSSTRFPRSHGFRSVWTGRWN